MQYCGNGTATNVGLWLTVKVFSDFCLDETNFLLLRRNSSAHLMAIWLGIVTLTSR